MLADREQPPPKKRQKPDQSPTPERLRELFTYDPDTGLLCWRIHRPRGVKPGDEAGTLNMRNGHVMITIDGWKYAASRIIWAMVHGEYPTKRLQFYDGDAQNLRLNNLSDQPIMDRYERKMLAYGYTPKNAADMADARANKTAAAILLADVNKAALAHIKADEPAWNEFCIANSLGKKRIIARFRDMLRAKYPTVYPTTHLTRGRE